MTDDIFKLFFKVSGFSQGTGIKLVPIDDICDPPDGYRMDGRLYPNAKGGPNLEVANLSEQLSVLPILQPLFVVKDVVDGVEQLMIVSGKKRLEAARLEASISEVPCYVFDNQDIVSKLEKESKMFGNLSNTEKDNLIAEMYQTIIYSDSAHSSRLSDYSTLMYFRKIRERCGDDKFGAVLKMLGLQYNKKGYRSALRIWKIACSKEACELIDKRYVPLSTFKKDSNIRVMGRDKICARVSEQILNYCNLVRKNAHEDDSGKDPIDCEIYDTKKVDQIIRDVEFSGYSKMAQKLSHLKDYRQPKLKAKIEKGVVHIPAARIDLNDSSSSNTALVVETLYKIDQIRAQLQGFVNHIKPDQTGETAKTATCVPSDIKYGKGYYEFIRDNHLEMYCDIGPIERYLNSTSEPLIDNIMKERLKGKKANDRREEVIVKLIDYVKRGEIGDRTAEFRDVIEEDLDEAG